MPSNCKSELRACLALGRSPCASALMALMGVTTPQGLPHSPAPCQEGGVEAPLFWDRTEEGAAAGGGMEPSPEALLSPMHVHSCAQDIPKAHPQVCSLSWVWG